MISNPLSVDLADFNHDGKLDLLVAGNGGYSSRSVMATELFNCSPAS